MNHKNKQEPVLTFLNTGLVVCIITTLVIMVASFVTAFDFEVHEVVDLYNHVLTLLDKLGGIL